MVEAEASEPDRDYGFGVLGPLRVTRAGVPLSLGGRQQRAVLARLLLADGVGLTVDQLADALWGEQVPVGAASTNGSWRESDSATSLRSVGISVATGSPISRRLSPGRTSPFQPHQSSEYPCRIRNPLPASAAVAGSFPPR